MIEKEVVSSFILFKGKILLLKRSSEHRYWKYKWGAVGGFVRKEETPYKAALREISEEISLESKEFKLLRKSKPIRITEKKKNISWIIYPFLFEASSDKIKLNKEHKEYKWIKPEEIHKFDYLIGLDKDLKALDLIK
jgi:ADP-ribose pyrophosphatase YjhB (NUDIX family)